MPWETRDRGDGWATRAIPGVRRSEVKPRTVILYNGEPVDRALKLATALARIKKWKAGELALPPGVILPQDKGNG